MDDEQKLQLVSRLREMLQKNEYPANPIAFSWGTTTDGLVEVVVIPEANLPRLQDKIAKLNRKAKRLNLPPVQVVVGTFEDRPITKQILVEEGETPAQDLYRDIVELMRFFNVQVVGAAPAVAGYTFVATLEHMDGEVLLRTCPNYGADLPTSFRTADPLNCDHCHTRRMRNETFVVREDRAGTFKQIGRNCLADFLGGQNPQAIDAAIEVGGTKKIHD